MIQPDNLKKGDTIGIVAPARFIKQDQYTTIINIIESKGFKVLRGKSTKLEHFTFAGTDQERTSDLQQMLDHKEIKAIFCLRGGYGTIRIIDKLDFALFKKYPKWLIGFSDITILHNTIHNIGVESIHGQMPLNFANRTENKGLDKLFEVLKGSSVDYSIPAHSQNRIGKANGEIIGGNVAILSSLVGTPFDIDTKNKVLFIEEVGEHLYRFDRLMRHLKLSGKLSKLNGLIVGGLTDMEDGNPEFIHSAEEIIYEVVKDYNYPVCYNFPAGHIKENYPLVFGREVNITVDNSGANIKF